MSRTFSNPILSGFYPDPSICRVEDDYYLVTSSFVYFPGLPIFHSKDLVHWEQIGHGIHRTDQLDYANCETSLGLWAPSIRYHNGLFYIINTFVSKGREAQRDNYIITATNPAGPWSNPIFISGADGIDSSLFFDEDHRIWYIGNYIVSNPKYEGHHGIYLCELDPVTYQFKGNRYTIWDGNVSRSKWIEAPHIYKRNDYYYLMVAEGGTFTNHSVMMARSKDITGPYEICPRNPIVSHRHMALTSEISVVGHADIVETQKGEWWMVLLGVRPYDGFDFNLGRETFLVPVCWDESDDWLRIDNKNGCVNRIERFPNLTEFIYPLSSGFDCFEDEQLGFCWNTIHPTTDIYSLTENPGNLRLHLKECTLEEVTTPSFIGRRQQHKKFQALTNISFAAKCSNAEAGIALLSDNRFHYSFLIAEKNGQKYLRLYEVNHSIKVLLKEKLIENNANIYLGVRGEDTYYQFIFGYHPNQLQFFYEPVPAYLLGSNTNEGFTGTYIGMYGTTNHESIKIHADYHWFSYEQSSI